jgi:molybdopterin-guanine dinucleotide biosynthesis protein A
MRIFGVILAGGQGRRLGGVDKAILDFGGARLVDMAIARLQPQVEELAISSNTGAGLAATGLPILADAAPLGPLAGLLAAMEWAAPMGADYIASAAVDCPHFPCDLVAHLRLALEEGALEGGGAIALARAGRVHGTFGLWPVSLRGDLAQFLQSGANPKLMDYAARTLLAYANFPDEAAFDNINTPQDLARIRAGLSA